MPKPRAQFLFEQGVAFSQKGDYKRALNYFRDALTEEPDSYDTLYNLACCYSAIGDSENALLYLGRACTLSFECRDWAKEDSEFEQLREEPEFQRIVFDEISEKKAENSEPQELSGLLSHLETDKGTIRLKLFDDRVPLTVANFVNLVNRGFYDQLKFHRVIPNFMIQTGCPLGTGTGGPGYTFKDEILSGLKHHKPGILSMANRGPNTNGSQFFITHKATPWLDRKHTIFGEVATSLDQEIVDQIEQGDLIQSITIQGDTTNLMNKYQSKLLEWNKILDKKFPDLRPPTL